MRTALRWRQMAAWGVGGGGWRRGWPPGTSAASLVWRPPGAATRLGPQIPRNAVKNSDLDGVPTKARNRPATRTEPLGSHVALGLGGGAPQPGSCSSPAVLGNTLFEVDVHKGAVGKGPRLGARGDTPMFSPETGRGEPHAVEARRSSARQADRGASVPPEGAGAQTRTPEADRLPGENSAEGRTGPAPPRDGHAVTIRAGGAQAHC